MTETISTVEDLMHEVFTFHLRVFKTEEREDGHTYWLCRRGSGIYGGSPEHIRVVTLSTADEAKAMKFGLLKKNN